MKIKQSVTVVMAASAAVIVGFAVGYGIGQKTREATPSNVKTDYSDGVVTIKANVGNALKQGFYNWADSL